jgi:hypothetical protein
MQRNFRIVSVVNEAFPVVYRGSFLVDTMLKVMNKEGYLEIHCFYVKELSREMILLTNET